MSSRIGRQGGYLQIDNRAAPASPATRDLPGGIGSGALLELDTFSCVHCQRVVLKNPLRLRPREVCMKCMAVVCDTCAPLDCRPFQKLIDDLRPDLRPVTDSQLWLPNNQS